jgi:hypothetical protein
LLAYPERSSLGYTGNKGWVPLLNFSFTGRNADQR